jgi:hypothetical protein
MPKQSQVLRCAEGAVPDARKSTLSQLIQLQHLAHAMGAMQHGSRTMLAFGPIEWESTTPSNRILLRALMRRQLVCRRVW